MSTELSPTEPLPELLRRGSRAVVAAQVIAQVVLLVALAVLYRVLGLEPFGLVAMVLPWLALMQIVLASGLDVATIQQADLASEQISALFWVNQALGAASALATVAIAPVIAWFFGREELLAITVALSGTLVAAALSTQHLALLRRRMRLASVAWLRLTCVVIAAGAAVAAAWSGWGVWTLVLQQYVELVLLAVLAWMAEPWRPSFHLRGVGARQMALFGGHCAVGNLMFYIVAQADKVLVGYLLGARSLALYSQAYSLMSKPVRLVLEPLSRVMLAALARAADEPTRYRDWVLGFFRFLALLMFPAAIGLTIVAPEAIAVLGGPKWIAAGPILRVLAPSILVIGFVQTIGNVLATSGRADRLAWASSLIALILCAAYAIGLVLGTRFGNPLLGVGLGHTVAFLLVVFPPYLLLALGTARIPVRAWWRQMRGLLTASLLMAAVVAALHWWLGHQLQAPAGLLLAVEVVAGAGVYLAMARKDVGWVIRQGLPGGQGSAGSAPAPLRVAEDQVVKRRNTP